MNRRAPRQRAALKAWNARADQWDGQAVVYDPMARKNVLAEWYKDQLAEPMMWHFDRMPPYQRARIANSADGFGNERATIRR